MGVELHVLDPSFYEHTEKKKPKVSLIGTWILSWIFAKTLFLDVSFEHVLEPLLSYQISLF
jgi:hypothetical protein